jgi:hypothetical protein
VRNAVCTNSKKEVITFDWTFAPCWQTAITKESSDMHTRKVLKKINRSQIPHVRRCVKKHKWVFKIKHSGAFRGRLVACGYSQIPGVDYTKNYTPVISDVT